MKKFLYKSRYFRNKDMKIFSAITFSWFMILNIYGKHKRLTGKGRDFWFIRMRGRPNFSSFLHQVIKELTTRECYAVSDMNHSSHQQVFYGSLWPISNSALLKKLSTIYCLSQSKYQILCTAYLKHKSTFFWRIFSELEWRVMMTSVIHKDV